MEVVLLFHCPLDLVIVFVKLGDKLLLFWKYPVLFPLATFTFYLFIFLGVMQFYSDVPLGTFHFTCLFKIHCDS